MEYKHLLFPPRIYLLGWHGTSGINNPTSNGGNASSCWAAIDPGSSIELSAVFERLAEARTASCSDRESTSLFKLSRSPS